MQQYYAVLREAGCERPEELQINSLRGLGVPLFHAQRIYQAANPAAPDNAERALSYNDEEKGLQRIQRYCPSSWGSIRKEVEEFQAFHAKTKGGKRLFISRRQKAYSEPALRRWESLLKQLDQQLSLLSDVNVDELELEDFPITQSGINRFFMSITNEASTQPDGDLATSDPESLEPKDIEE